MKVGMKDFSRKGGVGLKERVFGKGGILTLTKYFIKKTKKKNAFQFF